MIVGIQCDVSAEEMTTRLSALVEHHAEKEAFYEKSVTDLQAGGLEATGHSRDPLSDIRDKAKQHRNRKEFLTFIRDHLVKGETYRLGGADLATLGFVSERHY